MRFAPSQRAASHPGIVFCVPFHVQSMQFLFQKLEACSSLPSTLCVLTMMRFAVEARAASNLRIANSVVAPLAEFVQDSRNESKR